MANKLIERLEALEQVILHLASVHPGLFEGIPVGIMPEPKPGPEQVPVPDEGGQA